MGRHAPCPDHRRGQTAGSTSDPWSPWAIPGHLATGTGLSGAPPFLQPGERQTSPRTRGAGTRSSLGLNMDGVSYLQRQMAHSLYD